MEFRQLGETPEQVRENCKQKCAECRNDHFVEVRNEVIELLEKRGIKHYHIALLGPHCITSAFIGSTDALCELASDLSKLAMQKVIHNKLMDALLRGAHAGEA